MGLTLAIPILVLLTVIGQASDASLSGDYVSDVHAERSQRFSEVALVPGPAPQKTNYRDYIFNAELSNEFREKYRLQFGQIDTESMNYRSNQFERLEATKANREELTKVNDERRRFAEYMLRRLTEWHVDNFIKSEPSMRPIYETKERLKKVEVRVTKQTRLEGKYSFAGNTLDIIADSSTGQWIWNSQLDQGLNRLIHRYQINHQHRIESHYLQQANGGRVEMVQLHRNGVVSSFGLGNYSKVANKNEFISEPYTQVSIAWSF